MSIATNKINNSIDRLRDRLDASGIDNLYSYMHNILSDIEDWTNEDMNQSDVLDSGEFVNEDLREVLNKLLKISVLNREIHEILDNYID